LEKIVISINPGLREPYEAPHHRSHNLGISTA